MIRLFVLGLILVLPLAAQTVTLRSGVGSARITNCTNATPIVCTTDVAHGLSNGDMVIVANTMVGSNSDSAANGVRYAGSVTSTTLALYSDAGLTTPVAGNGAWQAGSNIKRLGKAATFTLVDHPRVNMGGPTALETKRMRCFTGCLTNIVVSGTTATATVNYDPTGSLAAGKFIGVWRSATASLNGTKTVTAVTSTTISWTDATTPDATYTDAATSEYAYAGNPAWDRLVLADDAFSPTWQTDINGNQSSYMRSGIRRWITNDSGALTRARWIIDHPEDLTMGTTACDETVQFCGRGNIDYSRADSVAAVQVYSFLEANGDLSSGDKATFAAKMLNDTQYGTCTKIPYTARSGTVTISGTSLTGTGTAFDTDLTVGATIWLNGDRISPRTITGITNATTATVVAGANVTGATWESSRVWATGDCGVLWVIKHHPGGAIGDSLIYPTVGAKGDDTGEYFNNLTYSGLDAYLHMGVALAGQHANADRLLREASLYLHDGQFGYCLGVDTGLDQMGPVYGWWRGGLCASTRYTFSRSINGYVAVDPEGAARRLEAWMQSWNGQNTVSSANFFFRWGEDTLPPSMFYTAVASSYSFRIASQAVKGYYRQFLDDVGYTSSSLADNGSRGTGPAFLGIDPQVSPVSRTGLPLGKVFNQSSYSTCVGMASCFPDQRFDFAFVRRAWSNPSFLVGMFGGTLAPDHVWHARPGALRITKGTTKFIAANAPNGSNNHANSEEFDSIPKVGSIKLGQRAFDTTPGRPTGRITRKHEGAYTYALNDHLGSWFPGPTVAQRNFLVHGEFTIAMDSIAGATEGTRIFTHFHQNGQASEGSTSLTSGKVDSASTADRILVKYDGPSTMRVAINDAYAGANIYTTRVETCPSADGGSTCNAAATAFEVISTVRMVDGLADTALTTTALNPDSAWTGVEAIGTGNGIVAMFARNGLADRTSVPAVTTTAALPYFASGLAAGTYAVYRNGSAVSGCEAVVVTANDNTLFCASVAAGSITVGTQAPPSIGSALRGGSPRGGTIR